MALCKASCLKNANCQGVQHDGMYCKSLKKIGTYVGSGKGSEKCFGKLTTIAQSTALARKAPENTDTGTDKTVCYPKTDPSLSARTENETGYAKAFGEAAKTLIESKLNIGDAIFDAKLWTDAIEQSRVADGASPVAAATTDDEFKNNFDNEYIMAWYNLLVDTFDDTSDTKKKFYAGISKARGYENPLGDQFGKIYNTLSGDFLTTTKNSIELVYRDLKKFNVP